MQLSFIMVPTVSGTRLTVQHWLATGMQELWRPDRRTVLLGTRDRAQVMVQDDPREWELGRGPVFLVDSVSGRDTPERGWSIEPVHVATGGYAAAVVHGCPVRYLDLSDCPAEQRALFA